MLHVLHNNEGSRCQKSHSVAAVCSDSLSQSDEDQEGQGVTHLAVQDAFRLYLYIVLFMVKGSGFANIFNIKY